MGDTKTFIKTLLRSYKPSTKKNIRQKQREADITKGLEILQQWPDDVPIYRYGGHGTDMCNRGQFLIKRKVPTNCLRITIAECGVITWFAEYTNNFFRSTLPIDNEIVRYPYKTEYLPQLAKRLLFHEARKAEGNALNPDALKLIHIRYPGTEYVQTEFSPFQFHSDPAPANQANTYLKRIFVSHSGLLEKKLMESTNIDVFDRIFIRKLDIATKITTPISRTVFVKILEDIGKNSPITSNPLSPEILETYDEDSKKILQTLVSTFEPYFEYDQDPVFQRTAKCLRDYTKAQALAYQLLDADATIDGTGIENFYKQYLFSFTKEQILGTYTASVFPTKEMVKQILDTEYGDEEGKLYYFDDAECTTILHLIRDESGKLLSSQIAHTIFNKLGDTVYTGLDEAIYETLKESFERKMETKNKTKLPTKITVSNAKGIATKILDVLIVNIESAITAIIGETVNVSLKVGFKDVLGAAIQNGITAYIQSIPTRGYITKGMANTVARDFADSITTSNESPLWLELKKTVISVLDEVVRREFGDNLTSEKLMIQYPGIHYSTICRSVEERDLVCSNQATLRRRSSMINEMFRRKITVQPKTKTKTETVENISGAGAGAGQYGGKTRRRRRRKN